MGSRYKNAGALGGTLGGEEVDFYSDLRLARRWKRRSIGCGQFGISARPNKPTVKTIHQTNRNNDAPVEAVTIDSDDEQLLDDIHLCVDARCVDYADGNDLSDVLDPQYMVFLANLKEDGKSYLLELASGIETPLVVKYEKEDGSNGEVEIQNLETMKCHQQQGKIRIENALKSHSWREKTENSKRVLMSNFRGEKTEKSKRALRSNFRGEKTEKSKKVLKSNFRREKTENSKILLRSNFRREMSEIPRRVLMVKSQSKNNENLVRKVKTEISGRISRSNFGRERSESPRRVLRSNFRGEKTENSKKDLRTNFRREKTENSKRVLRSNFRRELSEIPRRVLRIKSQSDNNENLVKKVQTEIPRRILRSNFGRENYESPSNGDGCSSKMHSAKATNAARHQCNHEVDSDDSVDEDYQEFRKSTENGSHLVWRPEGGTKIVYEMSDSDLEGEKEAEDPVSSSENGCLRKRRIPKTVNAKHQFNHWRKSYLVDESYQDFFLKFVKNGQHLEYTPEGGKKVVYEESDSDSEVMVLDNNPFSDGKPTPVVFVDLDGDECIENHSGSKESVFRTGLMEILRKPYDIMEYEKLLQDASYQRPKQGVRILRKRDKSYPLPSIGKSYLEVYSDLASVINHAQPDKRRILNLLRGLFYWLLNLAREGSFKPWLDSACLSTLPPVPHKVSSSS